ncbi:MAG: VWA domain-containing protein [Bacteroidetes bacterium]|nr:VWA domain-containing protein [Bacteroidota bacterium]
MKGIFSILVIMVINSAELKAQLVINKTTFDFGNIENFKNDTAFFLIENTSDKIVHLLPTQPKEDYLLLISNKQIAPNESIKICVVYFTTKKGKFSLELPIYFSSSNLPLIFNVKGNILNIDRNALNICPLIENSVTLQNHLPLDIVVKDFNTEVILTNLTVQVKLKNKTFNCFPGLGNRTYQCNCDYGNLNIIAKKEGYLKGELTVEYSEKTHYFIVYLKKTDTIVIPIPVKIIVINEIEDSIKPNTPIVKKDTFKVVESEIIVQNDTFKKPLSYKPNHLIFVIDMSGSMKDTNKLAYLKESMKALISFLKPHDFVTLITYATRQNIVFENISGNNKQLLIETIDSLTAKGGSYGADALDIAYNMAQNHFITAGNNQIFFATDGLFNGSKISNEDLYKRVKKKYKKYDIKLSTIAFGTYSLALEFLANLAENGNGQSLKIQNLQNDKNVLIEEVKKQSLIN